MTNLVPIDQAVAQLPATMRARMAQGLATNQNFADGVRDAFPLLSIKGKVFRARVAGQETAFIDPQTRQPIPFLDVVMVNGSRTLAKTYFIKGYTEGDLNPPDCWSLDSVRPDASVLNKVSMSCVSCPMNQFGSRVTDAGKPAKACQDARRVAVVLPHMLNSKDPLVMMLRVPQSSLKNLKAYAQLLERHGIDPVGVVTRMAFDYALDVAYPKLIFNFVNVLDEATYARVIELKDSEMVKGMLNAPDFTEIQTPTTVQNPQPVGMVPQAGPILENPQVLGQAPVSSVQPLPQQAQAAMQSQPLSAIQAVADVKPADVQLIELPEGRWYNPVTKEIIEAAPAPVKQVDPRTIALPGGQFFHMDRKVYVTGDEVGAPEVGKLVGGSLSQPLQSQQPQQVAMAPVGQPQQATQPAPKATRQRAPRKAMAPQQAIQPQTDAPNDQAQQLAAAVGQITGAPVQTEDSGGNDVVQNGGDAPGKAPVNAAPGDLESILKALLPTNPQ